MNAVMMRTGYLAVPDYFRAETAKSGEGFIERLTRRRLGQCNHYMMLTKHKGSSFLSINVNISVVSRL